MKVFIPHKKDFNIYFDEIINYSSCEFIFGSINDYDASYEVVNIQFPEAIFSWEAPSFQQLSELESAIVNWKKNSQIVLTLNDHQSHYDVENKFKPLFDLVYKYADGVIHLGNYSLDKFKNYFPNSCRHKVIYHPLYESLKSVEVNSYEEKINIDFKGKYVVSVIGNIRSIEEAKFVIKVFKKLKKKNKFLIIPKMINLFKLPKYLPYRLRHMYRFLVEKRYFFPLKRSQYYFGFNHIEYPMLVDLVSKTQLIIIPRIKSLNSGLVYLGLTFDKPMIIPKGGNMTEFAKMFNFPLLNVEKNNYSEVFAKIEANLKSNMFADKEFKQKKEEFSPKFIAMEYDNFFKSIIA